MIALVAAATKATYTLEEALEILGLSHEELAELAGISVSTVKRNVYGSRHKTKDMIALAIADALCMEVAEIEWPNGLTNQGRPPGKWDGEVKLRVTHTITIHVESTVERLCTTCNLVMPVSGRCGICE